MMKSVAVGRAIVVLAVVAIVAAATSVTAYAIFWQSGPQALYRHSDIFDTIDVAVGANEVSVAWAGDTDAPALTLKQNQGGSWTTKDIALPSGAVAWNPSLAYSEENLSVAWVEGTDQLPGTLQRKLMQWDEGKSSQIVIDGIYGMTAPSLASDGTDLHLAFAAATTSPKWANADLYYGTRSLADPAWTKPKVVLAHDKVMVTGATGGVQYPHLAVAPDSGTVHIVWQQKQIQSYIYVDYSVWHISGRKSGANMVWSSPSRISPVNQPYAVHPNVAVDADGKVHVVWTHLDVGTGNTLRPEAQHIYHRVLGQTEVKPLNERALNVNNILPTWAAASVAANGEAVCVTWHGYNIDVEATVEEVVIRCSEDGGVTWQAESNASESPDMLSIFPVVDINGEGETHAAWVEFELETSTYVPNGVYYRGGDIFSENQVFLPLTLKQR